MANTKKKIETESVEAVEAVEAGALTTSSDKLEIVGDKAKFQIKVKRVNNTKLEETLQEIGYENVAQILVEPSLGYAMFNIVYWGEVE